MTTVEAPPAATPATTAARSVRHRWPAVLGLALAALSLSDYDGGTELATVLTIAAAGYLLVAVLGRTAATWPLAFALTAVVVALRVLDVEPVPVLAAVAAVAAVAALASGRLRHDALRLAQIPVAAACAATALVAVGVGPDAGALLVAAGLLGHAAWDAVLWRRNRVIARTFTEWCGVLDLTLGAGILALTLT
jgi:hypothetical protein